MDLLKRIIGIVLIAAVVVVVVFLIVNFVKTRISSKAVVAPSASPSTEIAPETPGSDAPGSPVGVAMKKVVVGGANFVYPANWSILRCSNSANFEFNPYGGEDSNVVCDIALDPITVLVNSNAICRGEVVNLSGLEVRKYRAENARGVDYQWCYSLNGVSFNVTHRVSATPQRGVSKDDFSQQIESAIVQSAK